MSKKEKATAEKSTDVIYVGPSISGIIRHSTVFKDGILPDGVTRCIEQLPAMKRLFVETDRLAEAAKELNRKQSALNVIYAMVACKFK